VLAAAGPPDLIPKLWNVETGEEVQRFQGHKAVVRGSALSADGKFALTAGGNFVPGGLDTALRLWEVETGREIRRMEGHQELVWCVAFSSDGRRALSGGVDGTIRLWDVESGKELALLKGHEIAENDPRVGNRADVRAVLFLPGDRQAVSAGHDRTIRIWNLP
jgi:WD40 repeat protein